MSKPVALVTAASRGIGEACARALHAKGFRLALMSRSEAVVPLAEELGAFHVQGSVTDFNDLKKLFHGALGQYGRVDCVVCNTGHAAKGALTDITDEQWIEGMEMYFLSVARLARLVTPVMAGQGGGVFVNISSAAAINPNSDYPVSCALRAALGNYTQLFASQHASQGIRMNNVLPGFVDNHPVSEKNLSPIAMGRPASPAEVANVVAWLASAESSFVNGQEITVDGGRVY
ncbi:MAG: SDR family oxidoreductase [Planctomycetales bacterium]|nr:SDR family oxidoreductase [bacterium]UNM10017.1 MAG: SDR family oxidoreductase [Planctomycetales bacterium]